jgi:hypothetical protein
MGTIQIGTWNHIAVTRSGNVYRGFVNGVEGYTQTLALTPYDPNARGLAIGSNYSTTWGTGTPTSSVNGYINNLRIVKGTALYTAAFVPPQAPVDPIPGTTLLTCDNNAAIQDKTGRNVLETVGNARMVNNVKKYGTGAMYFDGNGDYLKGKVTSLINFGSGNFTIEGWVNLSVNSQFNPVVLLGKDTQSGLYCDISSSNNARIVAYIGGSWVVVATGSTALSTGTWYHLAFVRNGSSFKIYVDGVEDASATNAGAISDPTSDASATFQVAYLQTIAAVDRYFNGFIDDLRITKGVARYTSNFTPPTGTYTLK